jgi:hypothetical protein
MIVGKKETIRTANQAQEVTTEMLLDTIFAKRTIMTPRIVGLNNKLNAKILTILK